MFKTITNWITRTNTSAQDEWTTWEEWQRHQYPSHYEKSDIFQYYLSSRPQFQPPKYSCVTGYNSKYYIYCFGDFAALLVNPHGGANIIEYFSLLLDVYDICKGCSRRVIGDPIGIAILREVIIKRKLDPLQKCDFNNYAYPYNKIHAHTVTQYSLSTLIMLLVSNYLNHIATRGHYPSINSSLCQKAYDECIFGSPIALPTTSSPVTIQQIKPKNEETHGFSWPRDQASCLRCKTCSRVTENIWGNFDSCLDCHLKRICSICGGQAVIITTDGFPKCAIHQTQHIQQTPQTPQIPRSVHISRTNPSNLTQQLNPTHIGRHSNLSPIIQPQHSNHPDQVNQSSQSSQSTQPIHPNQVNQSSQSTQPIQLIHPNQVNQSSQSSQSTQPNQVNQSSQSTQPIQPIQLIQSQQQVQVDKLEKLDNDIQSEKSEQATRSIQLVPLQQQIQSEQLIQFNELTKSH
jgi:hypothetical protein